MPLRLSQRLLTSIAIIFFLFVPVIAAEAGSINYVHDGMNRLIKVVYGDGTWIEYIYDANGNRTEKRIHVDTTAPITTASPVGGIFITAQSVTLSCTDGSGSGCEKIYYTTNSSNPTTSSAIYLSPINVSTTITLKYFAKDLAGNSESVNTQSYTIDTIAPTTTAAPAGGIYNTTQSVTLICNDGTGSGCDKIYYTTDGTTPTTSSLTYSSPINISATTILKFFSKDLAGNNEAGKSQTYTISTSMVTVQLKDSNGNPLSGGVVQYYSGGWKDFGTTDSSGQVSKELQPGPYSFSMTYAFARQEKSQNTTINPMVVFQTKAVTAQLKDSTGALMDTGTVQYYSGGWRDTGNTSGGQITKELLPGTYSFSMNYAYGRQEKSQNITTDSVVVFQTKAVLVQLKDSTGALKDSGTAQYYSGGWRDIGSTSGGQVSQELLPGTYSFSMTYAFGRQEKSQNVATDQIVVFQTKAVTIQLKDNNGALMDTGTVQYYSGGWRDIGNTSGGQIIKELLPGIYSFSMTYAFGRQEKSQKITTDPTVVFQAKTVTIQLKDSSGGLMDTGTVQYYSGGWRDIGNTSGGQITKELLPGTYSFSMTYAFGRQEKSQNIANDPIIVFQTKMITIQLKDSTGALMDTGTVQYYSGGWRDIGNTSGGQITKELLPGTYSFSMTYAFGRQEKSQNINNDPIVVFITGLVHSDNGSCTNYYAGGWRLFFQNMELLPATYTFRFNDLTPDKTYTILNGTVNHIH
jgi:YD repeat-containing protein